MKMRSKLYQALRTLDDVTLVPISVHFLEWTSDGRVEVIREEIRAQLFAELKGEKVTLVNSATMTGEPYSKLARLEDAAITPRTPGGNSSWQLSLRLREKGKRSDRRIDNDFPVDPVILLRGWHALNFENYGPPPRNGGHIAVPWERVADYCRKIASVDAVLVDTTESAMRFRLMRFPECGWRSST